MGAEALAGVGLLLVAVAALGVAFVEARRRRNELRFHAEMLDAFGDRVCRFTIDDLTITYCNTAWATSVGTSTRAAVGRSLATFISPALLQALRQLLAERGDHDGESRREVMHREVDGVVVHEQWWDRVVRGAHGRRELLCVGRDVSEQARIARRLAHSERQHRQLIERLPLAAFVRRGDEVAFANQAAADLVGVEQPDELLGIGLDALFAPDTLEAFDARIARRAAGLHVPPIVRARGRTLRGDVRTVDIHTAPTEFDGDACILAVVNDVTALVEATDEVQRSEERFRALADRSTDVIFRVVVGPQPVVEYVNPAFTTLTGLSVTEFVERPREAVRSLLGDRDAVRFMDLLTSASGPRSFQLPIIHIDGTRRWIDVRRTLTMGRDGSLVVDGTLRDVTAQKSLEEALRDLANVDELTGLPNRRALEDQLDRRLRTGDELALLFLDLDRFKDVNDTLGHVVGDHLLIEVGARLRRSCRSGDFVARLAGDEFIVITDTEPEVVADRIRAELAMPLEVGDSVLSTQASIGVTRATPDDSAVTLLSRADAAMYEAKRARGGRRVPNPGSS